MRSQLVCRCTTGFHHGICWCKKACWCLKCGTWSPFHFQPIHFNIHSGAMILVHFLHFTILRDTFREVGYGILANWDMHILDNQLLEFSTGLLEKQHHSLHATSRSGIRTFHWTPIPTQLYMNSPCTMSPLLRLLWFISSSLNSRVT